MVSPERRRTIRLLTRHPLELRLESCKRQADGPVSFTLKFTVVNIPQRFASYTLEQIDTYTYANDNVGYLVCAYIRFGSQEFLLHKGYVVQDEFAFYDNLSEIDHKDWQETDKGVIWFDDGSWLEMTPKNCFCVPLSYEWVYHSCPKIPSFIL